MDLAKLFIHTYSSMDSYKKFRNQNQSSEAITQKLLCQGCYHGLHFTSPINPKDVMPWIAYI